MSALRPVIAAVTSTLSSGRVPRGVSSAPSPPPGSGLTSSGFMGVIGIVMTSRPCAVLVRKEVELGELEQERGGGLGDLGQVGVGGDARVGGSAGIRARVGAVGVRG